MSVRNGSDYIDALGDDRAVYLDGERVRDIRVHPAFRRTVGSFARLYDFQAAPENLELMTFDIGNGRRTNRAWKLPHSYAELVERRRALEAWSSLNCGWLGRSPDHVASTLSAMVMGIDLFERHGPARAKAVLDYYHHARENDLFVSYVIQNPQADRGKTAGEQKNKHLVASVVDEDTAGITVRGAKMLGTSSVMSDELFVANIQPLGRGEEAYALSFALPIGSRGLTLMSRKSYEAEARSSFDYPLSANFDENDAIVYFDDVKVPWERVFVYRDTDMARAQWHDTPMHVYQNYQSQVRLMVKMRFLAGVARRLAETSGLIDMPAVKTKLGELSAEASMVEAFVLAMEAGGAGYGDYFLPSRSLLYAAQVKTQDMYPKAVARLRDLAGGGVIMLPSSVRDFEDPYLRSIIDATQVSPVRDATERVRLFRMAWDAVGSEFASRHVQYEMFYSGASHITTANAYRTFDWGTALHMVDDIEALQGTPPLAQSAPAVPSLIASG
ncbi:4-hydroxyphenylacetate 3-monooxygenase [Ancylobacter sonchi]|uniref:4-hydroxyphenylacetate 3-hydroxylase family protein n=1 Tax=Ancylobacter sonchi TaxID=1937790 RepID=UPI001BD6A814|nr:4-hydroxyphenylacetate 3-hydroxylase N-terminal domain-containing protein [Ancylobacter sonchi]MBS7533214.1 4-hydroxyphenylacetate 3-monooxygenase [Ancylobacter sonchi]